MKLGPYKCLIIGRIVYIADHAHRRWNDDDDDRLT